MAVTDEEARARNRAYGRKFRARRRIKKDALVAKAGAKSYLRPPVKRNGESLTSLFEEHVRRVHLYLQIVEIDPSIAVMEKARIYISALAPFAKSVESLELRDRLEALEARFSAPLKVRS